MRGDTPVSVTPVITAKNPYQRSVVLDGSTNCDIKYGVAEIYDWSSSDTTPKVQRPTADSLPAPRVVIFPGAQIDYSADERVYAADFSFDTLPVLVTLDDSSDAPTLGDTVGTLKDSWGMKVGNSGFVVTGIVSTSVVYVRPAGSGGSSASLLVVQATANGSAGVIPAKTMTLKADPSLSPNYDLAANAVNYNYFKA